MSLGTYLPQEISRENQTLLQSIKRVFCFETKMPGFRTKTTKNIIFDTESLFDVKNQMKNIVACAMPKR
ncbi:MAG: hypothetical protein EOO80_10030 [Oxalobacteraceae bacterium]|nr:MAG: hypothetical protein EOO80_10030 [Oxalobacteraceae bacterium]